MIRKIISKIKTDKFWKNLFKNSFWAFAGDSSASIINLIITVLLIRLIGSDSYGVLILGQSYMSIMDVILNVQCWKSVTLYGQEALTKNKINDFNYYVKMGCVLDVATAICGGFVSYFLASYVGSIFNWSNELIFCAKIFSITIFSHLSGTSTALLRLLNKYNLVAFQKFIAAVIKLICFTIMYFYNNVSDLYHIVIIYCFTDIIGNILLVIFAICEYRKKYNITDIINSKKANKKKEFYKTTFWGTLAEIADIPIQYLDVFIISMLGTQLVAVLKVFRQIVGVIQKVTSPLQQSSLPQFSELVAKGEYYRGYDVVLKIRNVIIKYGLPLCLIVGLSSYFWLKLIYGELYSNYWYILLLYLVIQILVLSYTTVHTYFLALNKQKESTLYTLIANALYILIGYLLVARIGMLGIIIATSVQYFLAVYLKNRKIKLFLKEV